MGDKFMLILKHPVSDILSYNNTNRQELQHHKVLGYHYFFILKCKDKCLEKCHSGKRSCHLILTGDVNNDITGSRNCMEF